LQECIGGSDHLPILITVETQVHYQPVVGKKRQRWRDKDVDWKKFHDAFEDSFTENPSASVKTKVDEFTKLLTDTASKHVGKVKVGKHSKTWINPAIRTAIRKRNKLRKSLKTKKQRQDWLTACKDVNDQIHKSKTDSWRELLEDAIAAEDDSKLWRIIKNLNGSPESNAPNEAMIHKGRVITSNKQKADLFARHYAAVSRLTFTDEERAENLYLKKILKSPSVDDSSCSAFTMSELKQQFAR
jgi:hypothetical protein